VNRLYALAAVLLLAALCAVPARAENLKLLISVSQQNIVAPNPVRATLHFHNSGRQTIWLYRPVTGKMATAQNYSFAPEAGGPGSGQLYGGSTLEVRLAPQKVAGSDEEKEFAGSGFAMAPDALPYPRLVRLAPGKDYEEKVSLHVAPAHTKTGTGNRPVWGAYTFSVIYSADYSNAAALARDINAELWHGQAISNTITLNLQPPTVQGSVAGSVIDSLGRPYGQALVTLDDDNENSLDQLYTDDEGRFSFTHLAAGHYWLTVRQPGSPHDTSVFREVDLKQANSAAAVQIMMLPVQINKADRLLHKPVLFHIVDNKDHPLANVRLVILYSAENVVENVKAQTAEDGFTAISLIPGSNFVTLRMKGCKEEDRQAGVAPGPGVDGFKFVFDCTRK